MSAKASDGKPPGAAAARARARAECAGASMRGAKAKPAPVAMAQNGGGRRRRPRPERVRIEALISRASPARLHDSFHVLAVGMSRLIAWVAQEHGLSVNGLTQVCGLSRSTLRNAFDDGHCDSIHVFGVLCDRFNYSEAELMVRLVECAGEVLAGR